MRNPTGTLILSLALYAVAALEARAAAWDEGLDLTHPDSARIANASQGFYGGADFGFAHAGARGAGPGGSLYFGGNLSSGRMIGGRVSFSQHKWMNPPCPDEDYNDESGGCWYNNQQTDLALQLETRALFPWPKIYWRAGAGMAYYDYKDRADEIRMDQTLPSSSRSSLGFSSSAGLGTLVRMSDRLDMTLELGAAGAWYYDGQTRGAVTATLGFVLF